jgi:hypothetical protein
MLLYFYLIGILEVQKIETKKGYKCISMKTKQYKMASSSVTVTCATSLPIEGNKLVERTPKKIKIDLSRISCLLNRTNDVIETVNINNILENENKDEYINNYIKINDDIKADAEAEGDGEKSGYYYRNRERKLEYQKKYNKEQGDKIKNYNKDYYQKRREEILEKAKTKITCDCGCEVQLFNMNSHKKTKKHAKALQRLLEAKD